MFHNIPKTVKTACAISFLAMATTSCTDPGTFCAVYGEPLVFNDAAADAISTLDPDAGRAVVALNVYAYRNCGPSFRAQLDSRSP